jgi:hypothetical protein
VTRDEHAIEVRSYRTVFDLERRLYRIDRLRLNPGGVPVRGIVYTIALAILVAALGSLPGIASALEAVPWPVRHVLLPAALGAVLTLRKVDGRPFHVAICSLIAMAVGPRRLSGLRPARAPVDRWSPGEIVLIPDGSEARPRRTRFRGPGAVLVAVDHELRERGGRRVGLIAGGDARAEREVIVLAPGGRLDVTSAPGR